jgi:hypothetical protein
VGKEDLVNKFEIAEEVFALEAETNIQKTNCPVCDGYKQIVEERGSSPKQCPQCDPDGDGKISIEIPISPWTIAEKSFFIKEIQIKKDKNGESHILICSDKSGQIKELKAENCFKTAEKASVESQRRNLRTVFLIDFDHMTFIFEDYKKAISFCEFFLRNGSAHFESDKVTSEKEPKNPPGKMRNLSRHAANQGLNLKIGEMCAMILKDLPVYGGVKVLSMRNELGPHYLSTLFGLEEIKVKTKVKEIFEG